jgi:3-oxoacyl-[acyl-carrier protein] reductase
MTTGFCGKVAIITGGAGGIGSDIARRLAREGAIVEIIDRDEAGARALTKDLEAAGSKAAARVVDVRRPEQIQAAMAEILAARNRMDILVNNAGGSKAAAFLDTSFDLLQDMIALNLTAGFLFSQLAGRVMAKQGSGRILNIASHSALLGSTGRSAYAAAKGGLVSLTRVAAVELAVNNVTVNAIAPGPIDVPRTTAPGTDTRRQAWLDALPLKRRGKPEDVAALAVFLVSDAASYITGQVIPVDGGFTAAGLML